MLRGQEEPEVLVIVKQVLVGRGEVMGEEGGGVVGIVVLVGEPDVAGAEEDAGEADRNGQLQVWVLECSCELVGVQSQVGRGADMVVVVVVHSSSADRRN